MWYWYPHIGDAERHHPYQGDAQRHHPSQMSLYSGLRVPSCFVLFLPSVPHDLHVSAVRLDHCQWDPLLGVSIIPGCLFFELGHEGNFPSNYVFKEILHSWTPFSITSTVIGTIKCLIFPGYSCLQCILWTSWFPSVRRVFGWIRWKGDVDNIDRTASFHQYVAVCFGFLFHVGSF